jgi:hypothetical protein
MATGDPEIQVEEAEEVEESMVRASSLLVTAADWIIEWSPGTTNQRTIGYEYERPATRHIGCERPAF